MKATSNFVKICVLTLCFGGLAACSDNPAPGVGPAAQPGTVPTATPTLPPIQFPIPTATPTDEPTATPSSAPALAVSVGISSVSAFGQNPLLISVGTTVTWTNNDSSPHVITAKDGSFVSGPLAPGASFSFTFTKEGKFEYSDAINSSMSGIVQVGPRS
jgi:plastocyanin